MTHAGPESVGSGPPRWLPAVREQARVHAALEPLVTAGRTPLEHTFACACEAATAEAALRELHRTRAGGRPHFLGDRRRFEVEPLDGGGLELRIWPIWRDSNPWLGDMPDVVFRVDVTPADHGVDVELRGRTGGFPWVLSLLGLVAALALMVTIGGLMGSSGSLDVGLSWLAASLLFGGWELRRIARRRRDDAFEIAAAVQAKLRPMLAEVPGPHDDEPYRK